MNIIKHENEAERLRALHSLKILGSERSPEYDAVVDTIAAIFDCPIALISLVDAEEQWFKACHGLGVDGTTREVSFCQHALQNKNIFVVRDAKKDPRFRDNPLVTGDPYIRFYAGVPITVDGHLPIGTLCVIDRKPRRPSKTQLDHLARLGKVVEGLIKSYQAKNKATQALEAAETQHQMAVRSNELIKTVADVSGVGGWELILETSELNWTAKTREIHEVGEDYLPNVDEAIGFYAEEYRDKVADAVQKAIINGSGWSLDSKFTTAKGRKIWVRSTGRPVIEDGKVTRLVGAFLDITEQKLIETTIRHSEALQRTTLEALGEGVLLLSRSGHVQSVNPAACQALGYAEKEIIGKPISALELELQFGGKSPTKSSSVLQAAAAHPERVKDVVAYVLRKGAEQGTWLRVNAHAIDPTNEFGLDGVVISLKDISENKRQGDALEAVFDNFPGGIAYHDAETRMVACNQAFRDLFQMPEELIAQKLPRREYMLYSARRGDYGEGDPEKLVDERIKLVNDRDAILTTRKTPDGRYIETRSTPLPDGGMIFGFIDVTENTVREQSIQNSEIIQRTTLEALSEGVLLLDQDGAIQSANPAILDVFELNEFDIIGKTPAELGLKIETQLGDTSTTTNPLELAAQDPLIVTDMIARFDNPTTRRSSWLRFNARPVNVKGEFGLNGIVISIADITEAKQQADTLQTIFDNFPGGVAYFDENLQLQHCNEDYGLLLGYPKEILEQKLHILDYLKINAELGDFGPGDPETLALERLKSLRGHEAISEERKIADQKYLEIRGTPLPNGSMIYNFFDITDRKIMEKRLAQSERSVRHRFEELETVLANMRQGVSVFDKNGRITLWNQQYIDIFSKAEGEVAKGKTLRELMQAEKDRGDFEGDIDEHIYDLMSRLSTGEIVRSKFAHNNGKIVSVIHAPLPDGGWIGTHEDVTQREQAAAKITYAAHHDSLTGLANRTLFNSRLNESLTNAQIHGQSGNLLLLDLDKFKPVNDTFGHDVGDELLKQVAVRLKDCVRSSDLVARLGGDEFAIILPGTGIKSHGTAEIASRVVESIQKPFKIFSEKIEIGVSVGIAPILPGDNDTSTIIKKADIALYEVKHNGRNDFRFYDENSKLRPIKTLSKAGGSAA